MVDLQRYQGKFYEIYRQNAWFEYGCEGATADYTYVDNKLQVLNTCYSKNGTGKQYSPELPNLRESRNIKGVATPTNDPFALHIKFDGMPIPGIYRVFYTDYDRFSIVGDLETNYLAFLSRTPTVSREDYEYLADIARSYGFKILL